MEIEKFKYSAEGAYPELTGVVKNSQYARILHNLYAGRGSEMTATLQYCYQSFNSAIINKEIAEVFLHIGEVEMHHMELLANAVILLGGNPTYSNSGGWWNGSNVYYNGNLINMINRDLRDEELAILDYKKAMAFIKNDSIDALIERIIRDEETHIEILTRLKDAVSFYMPNS